MFEATIVVENDITTVQLAGRLDVKAAKDADKSFNQAVEEGHDIVLDCSGLEYIASAGLRALKRLRTGAKGKGVNLVVRNVNDDIMEVFELTGFAAMFIFE